MSWRKHELFLIGIHALQREAKQWDPQLDDAYCMTMIRSSHHCSPRPCIRRHECGMTLERRRPLSSMQSSQWCVERRPSPQMASDTPSYSRDDRMDAAADASPSHLRRIPTVVLPATSDTLLEMRGSDVNPLEPSIQMSWASARTTAPAAPPSYVDLSSPGMLLTPICIQV
jgi:hypothetical protein